MKTILKKILLLIAIMMLAGSTVHTEESSSTQVGEIVNDFNYGKVASQLKPAIQTNTNTDVIIMQIKAYETYVLITAVLYAFSLIIIIIFMWDKKHQSKDIVTMVGMVSVIFGTILLVLMVGDTGQLTAPMGILGAIAGYLFGASKRTEEPGEG